jgi:L-cysteate sulfo-lyase
MIERPFRLATLPTPLHPLERLSTLLGPDIWIKRDDLTGYAMGGNKVRKAEFLLADALSKGADVVLTAGAVQSNHARVIASVSRRFGMECRLYLSGQAPDPPTGNLLLDRLAEARIQFVPTSAERNAAMERDALQLREAGRRPYVIPIGGSNAVGSLGYAAFFEELVEQLEALPPKPAALLFPTSSGGTYAGILAGKALTQSPVELLGVRVDFDPNPEQVICEVANRLAEHLGIPDRFTSSDVPMNPDFVGEGYGHPTDAAQEAIRLLWQEEGVLLDPVYTGKAMSGLLSLARQGAFSDRRVIFLHTGGAPGVFR